MAATGLPAWHGAAWDVHLVALCQVVGVQYGIQIVASGNCPLPLLVIARMQPPLQVPAHALERRRCDHACARGAPTLSDAVHLGFSVQPHRGKTYAHNAEPVKTVLDTALQSRSPSGVPPMPIIISAAAPALATSMAAATSPSDMSLMRHPVSRHSLMMASCLGRSRMTTVTSPMPRPGVQNRVV